MSHLELETEEVCTAEHLSVNRNATGTGSKTQTNWATIGIRPSAKVCTPSIENNGSVKPEHEIIIWGAELLVGDNDYPLCSLITELMHNQRFKSNV